MDDREIDKILKELKERKISEAQILESADSEKQEIFSISSIDDTDEKTDEPSQEVSDNLKIEEEASPDDNIQNEEAPQDEEPIEQSEDSSDEQKKDFYFADYEQDEYVEQEPKKNAKGRAALIAVAVCAVIAIALGIYFGLFYDKSKEPETQTTTPIVATTQPVTVDNSPKNPLTGESGFNENAVDKRPVAVVVENEYSTASVKPQWGIKQSDIVLEGESEFSTRMLFFYADYSSIPKQVGPTRSARPPFIYFSQLFNAIFIHAGLSHSGGGYVGADDVFANKNIDHINLLSLSEGGKYFGRDYSRTSTVEHTGFLNGENVEALLSEKKIDTTLNTAKFTALSFNEKARELSDNAALKVGFKWSSNCPKNAVFTYNKESHKYTTADFDSKFGTSGAEWENLILLLDKTQYVVKENYKGSGKSETYCNYELSGGTGLICSEGTSVEISWGVADSKLWMKDLNGNEISLNPGKTYIGYGSSNHSGAYSIITDTQK
ncbi:MAG: DUF3048 domain-containing protein [Eubacteriales bacterium]|nr:DUF3048 domain-containing protein [Eubacteriales bacterium]